MDGKKINHEYNKLLKNYTVRGFFMTNSVKYDNESLILKEWHLNPFLLVFTVYYHIDEPLWSHSGIIGERLPIRLYLTVGMLTSGLFTCLFGLGYVYNIHSLGFYIFVQVWLNIMYY